MNWLLYDRDLRHERVNMLLTIIICNWIAGISSISNFISKHCYRIKWVFFKESSCVLEYTKLTNISNVVLDKMLLLSKMDFWDLIQILSTLRMQKLNQSCNQQSKTHLLIIKKVIFVLKKGRQFEGLHFNISLKLMVSFISNRSDNFYLCNCH